MNVTIRILSDEGIERFREYLDTLIGGATDPPPDALLTDPSTSSSLDPAMSLDSSRRFTDKIEFGHYLTEVLEPIRSDGALDRNVGFWTWLALFYFDQLCPAAADGTRKPGANHRYILSHDFKHHYRHLVRTPYLVYALHGERSRIALSGELHKHGEASEQILSREHLFTNVPLFEAMDRLYINSGRDGKWQLKRGARGRSGGSLRRLGKIVRQFDLTYDLRAMSGEQVLSLLPPEFDIFKRESV